MCLQGGSRVQTVAAPKQAQAKESRKGLRAARWQCACGRCGSTRQVPQSGQRVKWTARVRVFNALISVFIMCIVMQHPLTCNLTCKLGSLQDLEQVQPLLAQVQNQLQQLQDLQLREP